MECTWLTDWLTDWMNDCLTGSFDIFLGELFFIYWSRSQWSSRLRRRSADARVLRLWVRIPPGAWMFVCCECCMLSGRGICDELITRPEESYQLWRVVVCDLETSWMRSSWPTGGCRVKNKKKIVYIGVSVLLNCSVSKTCGQKLLFLTCLYWNYSSW